MHIGMQELWLVPAAASVAAWSYVSEQQPDSDMSRRYAWTLLALAMLVALAARLARSATAAQLAERVDGYALATLAGLRARSGRLSPFHESLLFALSLPAERVLQRLAGLFLQTLSAGGTHA